MLPLILLLTAYSSVSGATDTSPDAVTTGKPVPIGSEEWILRVSGSGSSRCKVMFTSDYGYRQFFLLNDAASGGYGVAHNPLSNYSGNVPPAGNVSNRILLHFQVMAENNAHILMSSQRRSDRDGYEIVLGAGGNTYTDLRRMPIANPRRGAFNYTTGVVSGNELRAFWLVLDMDTGLLAVGPAGGGPIVSWTDPDPIRVRYFSLCTWIDVQGVWLYGCEEKVTEVEPEEPTLPWPERLRRDVFLPLHRRAPEKAEMAAEVRVDHLVVDDRQPVVYIHGTLFLEWKDERLNWSPDDYGTLNFTVASPKDIWIPDLRLLDSLKNLNATLKVVPFLPSNLLDEFSNQQQLGSLLHQAKIWLNSTGWLRCETVLRLRTWCLPRKETYGSYSYSCKLDLGVNGPHIIQMHVLESGFQMPSPPASSGWNFEPALSMMQNSVLSWGESELEINCLSIFFNLQIRNAHLTNLFIATFTAACTLCVLCLLYPCRAQWRTLLGCPLLLLVTVTLLTLHATLKSAFLVASKSSAVTCISTALVMVGFSLILPKLILMVSFWPFPKSLHKFMNSTVIRMVLCCQSKQDNSQRWHETPCSAEQALEMLQSLDTAQSHYDWQVLAVALNKVCMLCCLGLMIMGFFD